MSQWVEPRNFEFQPLYRLLKNVGISSLCTEEAVTAGDDSEISDSSFGRNTTLGLCVTLSACGDASDLLLRSSSDDDDDEDEDEEIVVVTTTPAWIAGKGSYRQLSALSLHLQWRQGWPRSHFTLSRRQGRHESV